MTWRIGVDSGGTFTDICLFDDTSKQVVIWKVPSTPDDPSRGITQSVSEGIERVGASAGDVRYLGHGTTVATNALIQNRGVRTGLITTDGFRDLLEIGRQKRPHLYDLQADKPETLVARDLRLGVVERTRSDGSIETALDEAGFRSAVRALRNAGVESVAVCFLYSFLNAEHEAIAARILAEEFPEAFAAISHKIAPEFREFERLSTTVVNAYLGPLMRSYITMLQGKLAELGIAAAPQLTQSNGGVIGFDVAADMPVRTVLSGPSTGVVAAQALGRMTGYNDMITFDMGGTSSDVALLDGGLCHMVTESSVHGYPIKAPMLDIHTVGAGGGSIAHVDSGGLLKVGPRSAGANPGPACYGLGNLEPTVTDANVLLQTQDPSYLLNGRMKVDQSLSRAAIQRLADQLGLDVMEAADGILDIVVANMAKAIRVISVQRGHDPRDYMLVAFGGAGPVHAARLAQELGMKRILIPHTPGVLCALGLLMADLRTDYSSTRVERLDDAEPEAVQALFAQLGEEAQKWFAREAIGKEVQQLEYLVDLRFAGQNYEIQIAHPDAVVTAASLGRLRADFLSAHRQLYGFADEKGAVEMVTYRLVARGLVDKADFPAEPLGGADSAAARTGMRQVWMRESGGFVDATLYDRDRLMPGNVVPGPAIINQMDTTTVVPRGMVASVDPYRNLVLEAQHA